MQPEILAKPEQRDPRGHGFLFLRQRSEQYLTSSQTFSHFLRQVNGNPQAGQVLVGRSDFLR